MWEVKGGPGLKPAGLGETDEAFLGCDVHFKGVVSFEGTVRINGRLDGEIHTKGTLIVGERGVITGNVTAGTLVSGGRIKGTITATERVQLLKSSVLLGEVHTPAIQIEEGAHIQGISDVGAIRWDELETRPGEPDNVHDLSARRGKPRPLGETEVTN